MVVERYLCSTELLVLFNQYLQIMNQVKEFLKTRAMLVLLQLRIQIIKYTCKLVHRNGDGQLISIIESTANAGHISHKLTDDIFDTLMGKKEIIIIDNIKYEKVQYTFSPTLEQRWMGMYPILGNQITININVEGDAAAQINKKIKDHNVWKIHYCADFANIGHDGLQCIPVFQVLVPTMTLEPTDVITQYWTILRELN